VNFSDKKNFFNAQYIWIILIEIWYLRSNQLFKILTFMKTNNSNKKLLLIKGNKIIDSTESFKSKSIHWSWNLMKFNEIKWNLMKSNEISCIRNKLTFSINNKYI
jgi:hypothetical protein